MELQQHGFAERGRQASVAGSVYGVAAGAGGARKLLPDFEFSLGASKAKVLKALEESVPAAFVRFFSSPLYDRLLQGLVLYFCALLRQELLTHTAERSRTAHADGINPQLLASHLAELDEDVTRLRSELSQPYCEVILKHSSYKNQQQDKRFFESLYASLAAVLHEAFGKLGRQALLEQELGRLFRGKHFNLAARVHGPQRSVDSLTVMQLWEVKNETHNRALHAQLINSLFEKAPSLSVQVAAVSNTPLVSQAVNSPMVARSLLADPAERDTLLALPYSRTGKGGSKGSSGRPGAVNKLQLGLPGHQGPKPDDAAAGAAGSSPRTAAAAGMRPTLIPSGSMSAPAGPSAAAAGAGAASGGGVAAAAAAGTPGPRPSTMKPFQGVLSSLPEMVGLPFDENYSYLCLLRRCVLYGPTLGLPTGPPAIAAGRVGMLSLTGAAGSLSSSSSVVFRT